MGRFKKAIQEIEKALKLDPLSLVINRTAADIYTRGRFFDRAIDTLNKTFEIDPNFHRLHLYVGWVYLYMEKYDDALAEFHNERTRTKEWDPVIESSAGVAYALSGKKAEAQQIMDDFVNRAREIYISPYTQAWLHFGMGEMDRGFECLEKAYEERDHRLFGVKVDPMVVDRVGSDPRFIKVLKKIGLEK
jgi:tetratricopeptide (TPR) repeat protein